MSEITKTILEAVISLAVTAIASFLLPWIISKLKNEKVKSILSKLNEACNQAVKETYQVYVEELKGKDAFNKDAQAIALGKAEEKLLASLSDEVKSYITENKVDVKSLIEATIYDLKK